MCPLIWRLASVASYRIATLGYAGLEDVLLRVLPPIKDGVGILETNERLGFEGNMDL
tara:strand:+ start:1911 stop:2081 length:171 start_codon:yes stop_codon:yes gene_type:complete